MTTSDSTVLSARGLAKRFAAPRGPVDALRSVTLTLREGEFLMVTGPSGSGKTTFLNLASLLDRPTSGELLLDGEDTAQMPEARRCALRRSAIGMVFQRFHLLPHRSALDNVRFRFRYSDVPRRDARDLAQQALNRLGLCAIADQKARVLSSGEMQRVAIARAIALRPRLLVADEPTGNLDAASAQTVMDAFDALHRAGITILMVTHNESLLAHATRRIECADGRIEERCTTSPI